MRPHGRLAVWCWSAAARWCDKNGMASLAITCLRHAARGAQPAAVEAALRLGYKLLAEGSFKAAAEVCRQALTHSPEQARLWCALGAAQRHLAQMDGALDAYERAVELDPRYAQAWSNRGEWKLMRGENQAALDDLDRALSLDGTLVEALNNRVAALFELGRLKDAEAAARAAIERYPGQAALHVNLGNVLLHSGKGRPAVRAFKKALECDPACAEAQVALAALLGESGRLGAALDYLKQEIAVKGESAQRLASLALAQKTQGEVEAAEAVCRKVLDLQPGNISALVTLAGCLGERGDHRAAIDLHLRALETNPDMPAFYSNIAFDTTYLDDMTAAEVFDHHREWARRFEAPAADRAYAHAPPAPGERPLRIGYISGDFGTHPVGFLLRDVARFHDRSKFYIHCYSMMRGSDAITETIRANADCWNDVLLLGDDDLAEQIREDRIDILVDLSGHTAYNRLPVFVRRPAPVQATWIGYFHSTGLESIDYFITDPHTSPRDCGQSFSETPVWLPHSRFCYSPPDYAPPVAPPPSSDGRPPTFGSFNRVEKLVEPVLAAWTRILDAVPGSRLLLKAGTLNSEFQRADLRRRFAAFGVGGDRLELRGASPHPEMLAEYGDIDIALDPFPFNGGMTTLEALWMGVPVVTIAGHGVVSRQTVSALANLGLADELAVADVDGYVAGATALANDPARLAALRRELRPRMQASPICRPERFARDLEALYLRMWQAWREGRRLPSDIAPGVPDVAPAGRRSGPRSKSA